MPIVPVAFFVEEETAGGGGELPRDGPRRSTRHAPAPAKSARNDGASLPWLPMRGPRTVPGPGRGLVKPRRGEDPPGTRPRPRHAPWLASGRSRSVFRPSRPLAGAWGAAGARARQRGTRADFPRGARPAGASRGAPRRRFGHTLPPRAPVVLARAQFPPRSRARRGGLRHASLGRKLPRPMSRSLSEAAASPCGRPFRAVPVIFSPTHPAGLPRPSRVPRPESPCRRLLFRREVEIGSRPARAPRGFAREQTPRAVPGASLRPCGLAVSTST